MKLHIAYRTDQGGYGARCVSGSFTTLKERLRLAPNTEWTVAHYAVKSNVATVAQLIEDPSQVPYESAEQIRINEAGQVRKVS